TLTCRPACAPIYKDAQHHRARGRDHAECRSTPAEIAGARSPPAGTARRILVPASSSSVPSRLAHHARSRLLIQNAIAVCGGIEFHRQLRYRLSVSNKQISAWLQVFIKTLDEGAAPLFAEIDH